MAGLFFILTIFFSLSIVNANCRWEVSSNGEKGILDLSCPLEKYGKIDLKGNNDNIHTYKWSLCSNGLYT